MSRLWSSPESLRRKIIGSFHMFNSSVFLPLLILGLTCALLPLLPGKISESVSIIIHIAMGSSMLLILFTYWVSRRYGGFDWLNSSSPEILRTATLFLLMITGLSLSNGWAAAQGLSGKHTAFARTPKFNVDSLGGLKANQKISKAKGFPAQFYIECLNLVFFGISIIVSIWSGNIAFLDISAFFFAGYFLNIFFTLEDRHILKSAVNS